MASKNSTQTPRFPPGEQSSAQKAAVADAEARVLKVYGPTFQLKDEAGNLMGPFVTLQYAPEAFMPYLNYVHALNTLPYLTTKERELTVLAGCSITQAQFIIYAHKKIGMSVGLTQEQVDDAARGKAPEGLGERERCVYGVALEIARRQGKVADDQFEAATKELGREGVAALANVVGAILASSVLVNVADVPVPGQ